MSGSRKNCPQELDPSVLLDYLEGRLELTARATLEDHIRTCPACAAELASLRTVDAMLKTTPGAFHPNGEELYLFAQAGKDPDGFLLEHLVSCKECSEEVEALKEMISSGSALPEVKKTIPAAVMLELERLHPRPESSGWLSAVWGFLSGIRPSGVRMPVLALGTAAAAVMVIVVSLQTWDSFKKAAPQIEMPATVPATPVQEAPPQAPAESSVGRAVTGETTRYKAADKEDRARAERDAPPAPALSAVEPQPAPEAELSYTDRTQKGKPKAEPPAKTIPARKRAELKQAVPSARPLPGTEAPRGMRNEAARQEEPLRRDPAVGKMPAGPADLRESKISVEVRILDEKDRPIPDLKWSVPDGLDARYTVVPAPAAVEKPLSERRELYEAEAPALELEKQRGIPELIIAIKVRRAGEAYELEGRLLDPGLVGVKKRIRAENVARSDLESRIGYLVSSLLSPD